MDPLNCSRESEEEARALSPCSCTPSPLLNLAVGNNSDNTALISRHSRAAAGPAVPGRYRRPLVPHGTWLREGQCWGRLCFRLCCSSPSPWSRHRGQSAGVLKALGIVKHQILFIPSFAQAYFTKEARDARSLAKRASSLHPF